MRRRWPAIALAVLGGPASIVAASEPAIAAVHESDDDRPCDDAAKANRKGDADSELCQPSLEATFSLLSAYVFRGINVFQEEHQDEQKWVAKPRIVWTDATSKLEIGYTAIYQLTGDTIWQNVDDGVGSDQVLFVDYDLPLSPHLVLSPEIGMYVYPQAQDVPLLVEPSAELRYLGFVEGRLAVSYLGALRQGPLTEDYAYLDAHLEKTVNLTDKIELGMLFGAGVKFFSAHLDTVSDNMFDVIVSESAYYGITDDFYVGLKLAMAWTNLESHKDPTTGRTVERGFIDELAPFWGLILGADL